MIFHEHLVRGAQQSERGQILLHDVDAIYVSLRHLDDFREERLRFFEIYERFLFFRDHISHFIS